MDGFALAQVIYVKPGDEINLDSLIQDTIRLATAVKVSNKTHIYTYILHRIY